MLVTPSTRIRGTDIPRREKPSSEIQRELKERAAAAEENLAEERRKQEEAEAAKSQKEAEATAAKMEEDAAKLMKLAKKFQDDGNLDDAKKWFKKVVDRYPGTSAAKEAEELLRE